MGKICPKTKSYPPLIKQKLISTLTHITIILIDSLMPSLLVEFLPPIKTSFPMTLRLRLFAILKICIAIKISTVEFFILLNYEAMCANIKVSRLIKF